MDGESADTDNGSGWQADAACIKTRIRKITDWNLVAKTRTLNGMLALRSIFSIHLNLTPITATSGA